MGFTRIIGTRGIDPKGRNFAPITFRGDGYVGSEYVANFTVGAADGTGGIYPTRLGIIAAPDGTRPDLPIAELLALSEEVAPRFYLDVDRCVGDFPVFARGPKVQDAFQAFYVADYE